MASLTFSQSRIMGIASGDARGKVVKERRRAAGWWLTRRRGWCWSTVHQCIFVSRHQALQLLWMSRGKMRRMIT